VVERSKKADNYGAKRLLVGDAGCVIVDGAVVVWSMAKSHGTWY